LIAFFINLLKNRLRRVVRPWLRDDGAAGCRDFLASRFEASIPL